MKPIQSSIAAFVLASAVMFLGVVFFFKPLAELDTSVMTASPIVGLLVYMGLSAMIFHWAVSELGASYKAAFVVAAPQVVLIVDLTLRGERGWLTACAGAALLFVTWGVVAFVHRNYLSGESQN